MGGDEEEFGTSHAAFSSNVRHCCERRKDRIGNKERIGENRIKKKNSDQDST